MQPHSSVRLLLLVLTFNSLPFPLRHLLLPHLTGTHAAHIYPSGRLVVEEGQGFLVKLATEPGFGQVKYCTFLFNSQPYFLHPGNENEVAYVSEHGETVERFTAAECGVKVSSVTLASAGIWQLGATSQTGVDASADFQLQVLPKVHSDIESTTLGGRPGTRLVINCSAGSSEGAAEGEGGGDEHEYCTMWEDGMEYQASAGCKWETIYPDLMMRKEIRCCTFPRGSMESVIKKWTVVGEYSDTSADYLNGEASVVLRCKSKAAPLTACYMRNGQNGEVFRVGNGLKATRYSSYRSNLSRGFCQFEIPKPMRAEERGQWVMKVLYKGPEEKEEGLQFDECLFTVTDGQIFQV